MLVSSTWLKGSQKTGLRKGNVVVERRGLSMPTYKCELHIHNMICIMLTIFYTYEVLLGDGLKPILVEIPNPKFHQFLELFRSVP